jgi:NAD(P)-dependent dehydrogenase (short-subunit alcohol dehydrogenase family)
MGQPPIPPTPVGTSLSGKTIIITGGNAGLGYEAARQYLTLGAKRVILACRSVAKGEEAAASLRADPTVKTSNPDASIEVFELDLNDYQSGLLFSNRVKNEVKELDILLNNGGQVALGYEKSKSNHERNMQGKGNKSHDRAFLASTNPFLDKSSKRLYPSSHLPRIISALTVYCYDQRSALTHYIHRVWNSD